MKNQSPRRYFPSGWLALVTTFFLIFLPLVSQAQTSTNHAPLITSQPETSISTDEVYQYKIEVTDRDNDEVLLSLTTGPEGMTLKDNTLNWQPTKVGTYNVVIEAADQNNGYDTQAWQIIVEPGAIASIVITPNDRPTIINMGDDQTFTAIAYDRYNNEIPAAELTWTTDEKIGSINQQGLFMAKKGGIGFVAAENGNVKTSLGVVVKDIRSNLVTEQETTSQVETKKEETTTTPAQTTTEPEEATEEVMEEGEVAAAETEEAEEATTEAEEPCTNPSHWLIILMLIVYAVILLAYYQYEKKHKSNAWWIFPFLLTFIGLLVYYRYICPQTYLWWPWVMVGLGVITTLFYKGRKKPKSQSPDDQTQLPF